MSQKHKKNHSAAPNPHPQTGIAAEQKHSRRNKYLMLGGFIAVVLTAVAYSFLSRTFPEADKIQNQTKNEDAESQLTPQQLYQQIVTRTYAIDRVFRQVYTPGWQGANGAIGDAYLYAATHDQSLLYAFTNIHKLTDMINGTWVDDRMWVCLAEKYWWEFTGKSNTVWVEDARRRYLEAKKEGRFGHPEGFWSWYNWPAKTKYDAQGHPLQAVIQDVPNDVVFTNTHMDLMACVACWLYEVTGDKQFYHDAILLWDGDSKYPGIEKLFYKGDGIWTPKEGPTYVGGQFPWMGADCCAIGASLFRMTGERRYKDIAVATAKRIMDPANGWVDGQDFYQIRQDGNGAFLNNIVDIYEVAPEELSDIPGKIAKTLEHVWTNHHGTATVTLHRYSDDAIRNGWNPNGGEEGYGVDEIGTVHAQSQAVRAFGVFAYVLKQQIDKASAAKMEMKTDSAK